MNIEKIKEFISLRAELLESGVIGLDPWEDRVHVRYNELVGEEDLQITFRGDEKYPYELFVEKDGTKIFCIASQEVFEKHFPQFNGYMVEDVNLDGGEEHVS
jgi:hypothetical protein